MNRKTIFCLLSMALPAWGDVTPSHAPAPAAVQAPNTVKQVKEGELDVSIQGTRKDRMAVG